MSRSPSCDLSALLEVVRLVEEEGVPIEQLRSNGSSSKPGPERANGSATISAHQNAPLWPPKPPLPTSSISVHANTQVDHQSQSFSGSKNLIPGGPCYSCGITEAPQWRRPDPGTMLLCNRCGIHYMRYRKLPGPKREQAQQARYSAPSSPAQGKRKAESWDGTLTIGSLPGSGMAELAGRQSNPSAAPPATSDVVVLPKACVRRVPSAGGNPSGTSSGDNKGRSSMDMECDASTTYKPAPDATQLVVPAMPSLSTLAPFSMPNLATQLDVEQLLKTLIVANGGLAVAPGDVPVMPIMPARLPSCALPPASAALGATVSGQGHAVAYVSLLRGTGNLIGGSSVPISDAVTGVAAKRMATGSACVKSVSSVDERTMAIL